jgi:hypothetical protein
MKKSISLLLTLLLLPMLVHAETQVHTPLKAKLHGKKKLFRKAAKDLVLSNVAVHFRTTDWAATGSASDGLGVAAYVEIDEKVAVEIANDARDYLKEQLTKAGFNVSTFSTEELAENRAWKRALKKGKAKISEGGETYRLTHKRASKGNDYLTATAAGVPTVNHGGGNMMKFNTTNWILLKNKMDLAFDPTFYFIDLAAGSNSSSHKTSWKLQLALSNGAMGNGAYHRYFNKKYKTAGVTLLPHVLTYGGDFAWYNVEKSKELYGTSVRLKPDATKLKEAAAEMLRAYIDNVVKGLTEAIAKA